MNGATVLTKFTADTNDFDKGTKKVSTSIGDIAKGNIVATAATKAFSAAWGMVSRNMDTAINRYDTIQNFPKVMKNFGVSADEASKSVNRIADSVVGLPTSLDQAVAGVQDIFMVTKDLKKAEAMFQAVNDSAMVFANGSTQAVDLFIYAYKQAMASGKVSAQDFNQMNQAIPGVMDKVAESMGISFGALKEGLSNGSISMEQFNDTLQKLDTEGVGSMGAMRDAAFDATGGIKTAITNMNSRISAGLAKMIDAVNKGLKKAGLGNLATVFSNIGTTIKNILTGLAPYIVKAIGLLSSLFNWIGKNKDLLLTLAKVILPVVAALKIYNTYIKISNALMKMNAETAIFTKTAQLAQAAATKVVAAAQWLLNAAMSANPITWIIVAVVALIAIFALLWKKCEGFRNFWIGLWNGIVDIVKTAWNWIKGIFDTVVGFIKNNWQALLLMLVNPFAGAFKLIYDNCKPFRNFINNLVQTIIKWFNNFKTGIGNAVNGVVNFIKSIPGKIASIPGKIFNLFKSLPSKMLSIGLDVVKGIGRGITSGITWLKNRIKEFVGNVTSFIKKVFKIGSPSKLMAQEVGQWIPKGIGVGITANTDAVNKSMANMQKEMMSTFQVSPQLANSAALHYSPTLVNNVEVNMTQDPLGQMVRDLKTFSGGAKNDFNYGQGR